ncbi:hypothetical protein Isop_1980 [Isosphaera pallida ATCC 43644]|uniref:Uncharacterized protein n=1 Tax=Isosphaera pallida (strain ATCC 43644 / DSM 9630 / IS1B) TaxID=575540 RepID=E8R341_ISOPI|nr:hypothetical protein [Isosphaera pallida]ADV62560.1 hypothetical protein Isop_1980 [Isosphaera pallida ATCC 43644]
MTPTSSSPIASDIDHPTDRNDPAKPLDPTDHFRAEAHRLSKLAKARKERICDLERQLDRLRSSATPAEVAESSDKVASTRFAREESSPSPSPTDAMNSGGMDRLTLQPTPPAPGGKRPVPLHQDEPLRLRRHDLTDPRVMLSTPPRDLVDALRRGWAD